MTTVLRAVTCSEHQPFTPGEIDQLAALPDPHEELELDTWCELEAGHPGPHHGFAQISTTRWWWLRWNAAEEQRELVDAGFCGLQPGQGAGDCTLPAGHPGAHSYELGHSD